MSQAAWIETYRGMVYPWQCDHQGHLTTMHYLGMFDQAGWHLLNCLGLGPEQLAEEGRGFVDVKDTLEYVAEQYAGGLIVVESALRKVGGTSLTATHRMLNAATGQLAARCEMIAVHFDLKARVKLPLPDALRPRLIAHVVPADA